MLDDVRYDDSRRWRQYHSQILANCDDNERERASLRFIASDQMTYVARHQKAVNQIADDNVRIALCEQLVALSSAVGVASGYGEERLTAPHRAEGAVGQENGGGNVQHKDVDRFEDIGTDRPSVHFGTVLPKAR